ncbi:filamentous hemagglutinin N-terminal domain-containing protein, partial [Gammaproteobacteria bacterium]|nr:filamentous hemagglutinin N-terminal domain-containing protein [Gammaproteobacteria bacterium]
MVLKKKTSKRVDVQQLRKDRRLCSARLNPVTSFIRTSLPAGLLFGLHIGVAVGGPEGGVVAAGQASITKPSVTTTVVNQASQNVIVNWETFNVNTNETVNFNQPNNQSQALNRIFDQNPSQILGSINANGRVLLINPNGVFFNATASVDVGSLTASGLDISDSDFMNGKHHFINPNGAEGGLVVNKGLIQASTGGSVTLIGGAVRNEGAIIATAGQVNLIAGKKVTMDFDGDGLIQFAINEEILRNVHDIDDAVSNVGTINADGGTVLLKGKAAKDVFTNVVNNSGMISAGKIDNSGGVIKLVASGTSNSLINTGMLDVSSVDNDGGTIEIYASDTTIISEDALINAASTNNRGGKVSITGDKVGLIGNTSIDVSGRSGGGEVLIGGDYQGLNPDIQNASFVYVDKNTSINANAIDQGDGGKVILWANNTTRYHGNISARGGAKSGDGGFVEVSGKENLVFRGDADLTAQKGNTGQLLLDPNTITIVANEGGDDDDQFSSGDSTINFTDGSNSEEFTISENAIQSLGANILLEARNEITLGDLTTESDGILTLQSGVTLTMRTRNDRTNPNSQTDAEIATGGVSFDNNADEIRASGGGGIVIQAGTSNGTSFTTNATSNISVGKLTTAGGDITLEASGNVTLNGNINASGGSLRIFAKNGSLTQSSGTIISNGLGIIANDTVNLTAANNITTLAANVTGNGNAFTFQNETNGFTVGSISASGIFATTNGIITDGNINLTTNAGNLTLDTAGAGNAITATGSATVTIDANGAASNLLINDGISSANGAITLTADNDVIFQADGDIASTAGAVSVRADADNGGTSSGALTMVNGTVINAGSGTIALLADENITVGQVTTTNTSTTAVTLTSTEGGIVDGGDTGGADVITASGRLVIDAVTGVGSGNAIETTVASVDIDNATSGNIEINETNAITVFKAVQGTAGNIGIAAGGTITVDNAGAGNAIAAAGTGTVNLIATGTASDFLINDGILSVNGAIFVTAFNDVIFQADGDIASTAGAVTITADADNGGASSGALTMV